MERIPPMKKLNPPTRLLTWFFVLCMALAASLLFGQVFLDPPIITGSNTLRLVVNGPTTNIRYDVYFTNALSSNRASWPLLITGGTNQVIFDLTMPDTNKGFFLVTSNFVSTTNPPPKVATPVFSPSSASGNASVTVTVTCDTPGAVIYYTTTGATPTTSDNYIASGGTLTISCATTLKARAFRSNFVDSDVATGTYNVNCPPTVFAGVQQTTNGSVITLQGVATDDGQNQALSNYWRQVSGPDTVSFGNVNATNSTVTLPSDGIYVLQLEAFDGYWTSTSRVTVARNPQIVVAITTPAASSTFNVPTNIALEAPTTGSITQVQFYVGSTLIGTDTSAPWTFQWKDVPAGNHSIYAVATSSSTSHLSLASSPVSITVNFPTDIGRFTLAANDLTIPVAGLPIAINRAHDSRYGSGNALGYNARLDYESASIQKSVNLATGWNGTKSGINYCINEDVNTLHTVIVTLREGETYYFRTKVVFTSNGANCKTSAQEPTCFNSHTVRYEFAPAIPNYGSLIVSNNPNAGIYDEFNGNWVSSFIVGRNCSGSQFDPALSAFTFTSPDGTQYRFDSVGKLVQRIDRNSNTLFYASGSISNSNGKIVTLARDGSSRITEIRDPIALSSNGAPAVKYSYDDGGHMTNVARLVDRAGGGTYENTGYFYDDGSNPHLITRVIDPRGITTVSNSYDSFGRLTVQHDALGRSTSFTYEDNGRRQIVTDRNGNTTRQELTEAGQLESVQNADGAVTAYAYDANGRRIAEITPIGATNSFGYNDRDELIATTNELSFTASATYNSFGLPLTVVDEAGLGTTNVYDTKGNLIAITNAIGVVSLFGYDIQGNRTAETNAFGLPEQAVTLYQYDSFGYLTNLTDALGNKTAYAYDANGNRNSEQRERTLASGSKQTLSMTNGFDAANRVVSVMEPDGFTNRTAYNAINQVAFTTNKLGVITKFDYDVRGLLTNTVFALGTSLQASESSQSDAEGRRTNSVDRAGRSTFYSYDRVGRVSRTTFADGTYTQNQYDPAGRLFATLQGPKPSGLPGIPPPELVTRFVLDAAGRRIAVINAINETNRFAYDEVGNQTNMVDALGRTNIYTFDRFYRQVRMTFSDGSGESIAYDGLNRKVGVTNQAGVVSQFAYDGLGRLVAVTNGFGTGTSNLATYAYDETGNQTNQVDGLGRKTLFEYDGVGRRVRTIQPGGQVELFAYDAVGNLTRHTNFNAVVVTNLYDALNRLTNKSSAGGYNVAVTYTVTGQRATQADASGSYTFAYNTRDRLATNSGPAGTLIYGFDDFGRLASIASARSGGASMSYTYDSLNRVATAADAVAGSTAYGYDGVGNLQTVRYPNSVTNTHTYDSLNRLTNLVAKNSGGAIASFAYKVAAAGNRTNLVETVNGVSRTNAWGYDPLYRLTNETISAASGGTISYRYDTVGNRTNRTSNVSGLTNQAFTFNTNDLLSTDVYDSNGSTRTNGANTFFYDVENRLTNATVGGTGVTYAYNADGVRVAKTSGGTTTLYLVDDRNPTGHAQVLEELTVSGGATNLVKVFTYGHDLIAQRIVSNGLRTFYGYDGNGNTRYLTGTNTAVSDTYAYDAFGASLTSSGSTANDYLYAGEQYDPTLALYFLRARYLNTGSGRFSTRDNFPGDTENPITLHKYLYVGNDPANKIDPSGNEFAIAASLTVISGFSSFAAQITTPGAAGVQQRAREVVASTAGRPRSDKFWPEYPNYDDYPTTQDVWRRAIGGNLGRWGDKGDTDNPNGFNTCAARVSRGLNYSGASIPKGTPEAWGINKKAETYLGKAGDDKYYITGAGRIGAYLKKKWGSPNKTLKTAGEVQTYIASLKAGQCAIFATGGQAGHGHAGVLKQGYKDPYVDGFVPVEVWLLPIP